jgi:hypothetical protein
MTTIETCRDPDCRYVERCRFSTDSQTEPKEIRHSMKILQNGISILHVMGTVDSGLEAVVQELLDRRGEYLGLFVHINSSGGFSGSCKKVFQMVRKIGEREQTRGGRSWVTGASNGGIEVQGIYPGGLYIDPRHPDCNPPPPHHMTLIYGFQT